MGIDAFAHGFYQFLAVALGFFTLSFIQLPTIVLQQEVLGMPLVEFFYPIHSIRLTSVSALLENVLFYGLLALGMGVLVFVFLGLFQSKSSKLYVISVPASLFLILGLVVIFFTQDPLHASRLMLIFPVFLLL